MLRQSRSRLHAFTKALSVALAAVVVAACGDPVAPEFRWIFGSWEWVRSCCGLGGQSITPATEGYNLTYVFEPGGVLQVFRDDSLVALTTFSVRWEQRYEDAPRIAVIRYAREVLGQREQILERRGPDRLMLKSACRDCFGHALFARRQETEAA